MNIHYIREQYLAQLRSDIRANIELYKQNDSWIENKFKDASWCMQSNFKIEGDVELIIPESSLNHYDLENTKIFFSAFKDLKVSYATDERLWSYFCHAFFWKYMRARWPIETYVNNERMEDNIRERYFFMPNRDRALIRNGLARLWWYGYVSYDDSRKDPFELTKVLLTNLDIAESLLGRSFSRNRTVALTILSVLARLEKIGKPFFHREKFRNLMKYINQLGGVTILDALNSEDIETILLNKIQKLA